MPDRKQSKEKIGRLNKNPYHKDHFTCLAEIDAFECPEGQIMSFFNKYTEKIKIQRNHTKSKDYIAITLLVKHAIVEKSVYHPLKLTKQSPNMEVA